MNYKTIDECLNSENKKFVNKTVKKFNADLDKAENNVKVYYNRLLDEPDNKELQENAKNAISYRDFLKNWEEAMINHHFEVNNTLKAVDEAKLKKMLGLK